MLRALAFRSRSPRIRLAQMTAHLSTPAIPNGQPNGSANGHTMAALHEQGVSIADLPKSNIFTSSFPPDPKFPTPADSHNAKREELGPRMVKGALFTYVRPEDTKEPELLAVSERAMRDIGLKTGEEETETFRKMVAGNKIFWEDGEGVYPWAQCYGGA